MPISEEKMFRSSKELAQTFVAAGEQEAKDRLAFWVRVKWLFWLLLIVVFGLMFFLTDLMSRLFK
jgi:hypothetical protein